MANNTVPDKLKRNDLTEVGWVDPSITGLLFGRPGFTPCVEQSYFHTKHNLYIYIFSSIRTYPMTVRGNGKFKSIVCGTNHIAILCTLISWS